jgi:hypothetical protein
LELADSGDEMEECGCTSEAVSEMLGRDLNEGEALDEKFEIRDFMVSIFYSGGCYGGVRKMVAAGTLRQPLLGF